MQGTSVAAMCAAGFVAARHAGLLGDTTVTISKAQQRNHNSLGRNWFTVERGILWDEVVEYEEWFGGQDLRVAGHGWSVGKIRLVYE